MPLIEQYRTLIHTAKLKLHQLHQQQTDTHQTYQSNQYQISYLQQSLEQEKQKLRVRLQSIESLKEDIVTVKHKVQEEKDHAVKIEQSKNVAQRELHELGRRLFEEVDDMICIEKEQKCKIQAVVDQVREELKSTHQDLEQVQSELAVLRKTMTSSDEPSVEEWHVQEHHLLRSQLDLLTLVYQQPSLIRTDPDHLLLDEFKEFCNTIHTVPLRKLCLLSFMKLCLKSDIEPCLRFGPQPKMAARKIIDAVLANSCFIEPASASYFIQKMDQAPVVKTRLWDRFTASVPEGLGCQACGRVVQNEEVWKFRISYFDEWSCIDRYCRDRIVSVMEFYTFLRRLRIGVYNEREFVEVYDECTRLRLQMSMTRMGSLPWMLGGFRLDSSRLGTASSGLSTQ